MGQADAIRFKEFRERFSTEDTCRAELFRLRFAEGFVCPKCGDREFYPHRGAELLPVSFLPPPDLCHQRNRHAPQPSTLDRLVLSHMARGYRQAWDLHCPA